MWRSGSLALLALLGCDAAEAPRVIAPPDGGPPCDAHLPDAQPPVADDAGPLDAAPALVLPEGILRACAAPQVEVPVQATAPVTVEVRLADLRVPVALPAGPSTIPIALGGVGEGEWPLEVAVGAVRVSGPHVRVDRTPPSLEWPAVPACVEAPPPPMVADAVDPAPSVEVTVPDRGCLRRARATARDACGHEAHVDQTWRMGPPGAPALEGEVGAAGWLRLAWIARDGDRCRRATRVTLARAGSPSAPYEAGALVDVAGPHQVSITAEGCGGPVVAEHTVTAVGGPCDVGLPDLRDARFARARWEALGPILAEVQLAITAAALAEGPAAAALGEAAAALDVAHPLFAVDPGVPGPCFVEPCATPADHLAVLGHLDRAAAALAAAGRADHPVRGWQRCVQRAAETTVALLTYAAEGCEGPDLEAASHLAPGWPEGSRLRAAARCAAARGAACVDPALDPGACPGPAEPVGPCVGVGLRPSPDPIEFVLEAAAAREQLVAGTEEAAAAAPPAVGVALAQALDATGVALPLGCLGEAWCPFYADTIAAVDAWFALLEALADLDPPVPTLETCAAVGARMHLELLTLGVGRACPDIDRWEHPGLRAMEAALAHAPLWPEGVAEARCRVREGVVGCLVVPGLLPEAPAPCALR